MICKQCGNDCLEGSVFCTGCGASLAVEEEPMQAAPMQQPEEFVPDYNYAPQDPSAGFVVKRRSKLLPILLAVAAAAVVVVLMIVLLGGNAAESAAEEYMVARFENDKDTIKEFFHKKMDRDVRNYVYKNIDDFDMDIVGSMEMLPSGYEKCANKIDKKAKDIESAYIVYFTCSIEYKDEEYEGSGTVEVFEYDGQWYVLDSDIDAPDFFDDYRR